MKRFWAWIRRHGIRLVFTIVCALLALGVAQDSLSRFGSWLPRLSPILSLFGALSARAWLGWSTLLGVPLLIVSLLWGRVFCWWVCPMGFLAECASKLNPRGKGRLKRIPLLNQALAFIILVTAACGYPLLIWLDPLCIFNGFFTAWRMPLAVGSALTGIGFVLILVLSVCVPGVWCYRLCPLGGVQQTMMGLGRRLRTWWDRRKKVTPSSPKGTICDTLNIGDEGSSTVANSTKGASGNAPLVSRRTLVATIPVVLAGIAAKKAWQENGANALRPPSADVARINALCARCGNCMRACPYQLIHPDLGETGIDGLLTPVIHFRSKIKNWDPDEDRYCFQDCVACAQVCPTGALRPINSEMKKAYPIGLATIDTDKCLAWKNGEYCAVCDEYCPYKAVKLVKKGDVNCPEIDATLCRGCGACEGACPAEPVAIVVKPLPFKQC